jgi:hypothetical protein
MVGEVISNAGWFYPDVAIVLLILSLPTSLKKLPHQGIKTVSKEISAVTDSMSRINPYYVGLIIPFLLYPKSKIGFTAYRFHSKRM